VKRSSYAIVLLLFAVTALGSLTLRGADEQVSTVSGLSPEVSSADLDRAEALFAEGSFGQAHEIFVRLAASGLTGDDARWVEFRGADSAWRSLAATRSADTTEIDGARQALEALVRDVAREGDRDRIWAEVEESLGDFWWTRKDYPNWGQAWQHYQQALQWWAGSREIDAARERYLAIVFRAARPPHAPRHYYYGYYGNQLPAQVLHDALEISIESPDRAHASYLVAMNQRLQGGDPSQVRRTNEAFEAALEATRSTEWYDDTLYHYAEWLTGAGKIIPLEGGGYQQKPDYVRAVEMFRRLVREFDKGETRYHDQAKNRIENITQPSLGVAVTNIFLPGSEIQYHLNWRNVEEVQFGLYPVDLTRDLSLARDDQRSEWLTRLSSAARTPVRQWTHRPGETSDHVPGNETLILPDPLAAGAYLLRASGEGQVVWELVLVTRLSLVIKASASKTLIYACDAVDGSPVAGTDVALWVRRHDGQWYWEALQGQTDDQGLLSFDVSRSERNTEIFAVAGFGDQQSFSSAYSAGRRSDRDRWRIHVFTDRPAYRPEETVEWKLIARTIGGRGYATPSGETLRYRVVDPRGTQLEEGTIELNEYGSAWDSLVLGSDLPLGAYRIEFYREAGNSLIGGNELFRMEEYKLPEFKVNVETPKEDDRPRTYRVGDEVEAEIVAEYYFGGPVAGATVEAVVYQRPLYVWWSPRRDFAWYFDDMQPGRQRWWGGQGQVVERATLTTDAEGRARIAFATPFGSQDFEYTVEARVIDSSRREVVGSGTVRVSRQRYFAYARALHQLYRPGDEVRIELKTQDANEQPLAAEGRVRVTRERWVEIWFDPTGREVGGTDLAKIRSREPVFPPPSPRPGVAPWRLKHQGYEKEVVFDRLMRTNDEGTAELSFKPEQDGYYRVTWSGDEYERFPVKAETTVWVADRDSTEVGYHHGGVQILVDKDTLRAGRTTPVMISAPVQGAWVLFSIEGEELYDYRLVHLEGTVKLLEVEIEERYVPNVFLEAAMVHDGELLLDSRQVVVPPVDNFLKVEVEADREQYLPGEEALLHVKTLDHDGRPVSAEVALALVDDSIFYIQEDIAGDPRQFFYGTKRGKTVHTRSTFHERSYVRLAEGPDGVVVDRRSEGEGYEFSRARGGLSYGAKDVAKKAKMEAGARGSASMVAEEMEASMDSSGRFNQAPAVGGMLRQDGDGGGGAAQGTVQVRSDFRSTAVWQPHVVTDDNGEATVRAKLPDSLTTWRATARVADRDSRFGIGVSSTQTRKPVTVRLQAPRFFVVGDEVTLSAVINNNTEGPLTVSAAIDMQGLELIRRTSPEGSLTVPAAGETRVDWRVAVRQSGQANLTVEAHAGEFTDAMRKAYPVVEHGIEKLLFSAGKVRGDDVTITLDLPAARRAGSTEMSVQITPSMAVTMFDALPYLIDYPYGCTEQTMSRFLPSVIVARTMETLGVDRKLVANRIFGGIEGEHVDKTHADGERDLEKLDGMVRKGLDRLYDFQHSDGGWGWWKDGESDHWMTAYVVWGLGLARDAGISVRGGVLERAIEFLDRELVEEEERPDAQAWMLHALASASERGSATRFQAAALDNLWKQRDRMNAYSKALLALSAHHLGDGERALVLVRNLENGVKRDETPDTSVIVRGTQRSSEAVIGTAHWGEARGWWRWSDGAVESTAFVLRALLAIDPDNELIEPTSNWLIKNRRGSQWSNTRDTAIAVLAMNDFLLTSGELDAEIEYELLVNGKSVARRHITPEDVLAAPSRFTIDSELIRDGANEVRIVRHGGNGPIYFAAEIEFFSLEEPIAPAGNEVFVRRQYHRLVPRPTLLKGFVEERRALDDGGTATSGERVEVVVTLEAKNDYEYLVVEDLKPAGLEAVQVRSGEALYAREVKASSVERSDGTREAADYTGRSRWVYQELRDRKVALFIDKLPQGVWEIRYELRAEVPGQFHALPPLVHAMYVPEIRANGAEVRLSVEDR